MKLFLSLFIVVITTTTAQEITSFAGMWGMEYYQDDKKINRKEVKDLFSKNEEIIMHWKKADTKEVVAGVALLGQFAVGIWGMSELINDDPNLSNRDKAKNAIGPLAGSLGAGIIGAIFLNSANKSRRRAILTYNKQFDDKTTFRLEPITNGTGFGLAIKW